ncbi:MAG: BACON domain-containing protein [Acidobacteria bacterium]|nr:BACON domain-containing protein [Acidobacteriota bacterium]
MAAADRFWVAKDTADWIAMGSVLSGTGPGTVQLTVAPYTGTLQFSRIANLNIALTPALNVSASLTITQSPPACTYSVTPTTIDAAPELGSYSVRLTTQSSCPWSAVESLSWVTVSKTSGIGSATITVNVTSGNSALNITPAARRGSMTMAGRKVDVVQRGGCLTCPE